MTLSRSVLPVLVAAGALLVPSQAEAVLTLEVIADTGSGPVSSGLIVDGSASDTLAGTTGALVYAGGVGGFEIQVSIAVSTSSLGGATTHSLSVNTSAASLVTGGTLTIRVSDTDFVIDPDEAGRATFAAAGTSFPSNVDDVTARGWLNPSNTLFGTETELGPVVLSPLAMSGSDFHNLQNAAINPFGLTLESVLVTNGPGFAPAQFNSEIAITAVPEPGTLALLGIGLSAAGLAVRRRRSAQSR